MRECHEDQTQENTRIERGAALTDEDFLRTAMQSAQEAIEDGDMPFGACVINEKRFVLSVAHNRVDSMDPTAHAEMQAIKEAGERANPDLRGCVLYTTFEPRAMCFSACVWSKLARIVYAASNEDSAASAIDCILISSIQMKQLSRARGDCRQPAS